MFSKSLCHKVTIGSTFDQFGLCNEFIYIKSKLYCHKGCNGVAIRKLFFKCCDILLCYFRFGKTFCKLYYFVIVSKYFIEISLKTG